MKICTKCKVEKELAEFSKDKHRKDGFRSNCKSCSKAWRENNKDKIKIINKAYQEANKEKIKAYDKAYYEANKEKKKAYRKANKERFTTYSRDYQRERKKTDPLFKMKHNLRVRNHKAFKNKGYKKTSKTQEMLGVDYEIAKEHIEKQFTKGMSWNNYGEWHIDHIIPLASVNTEEEMIKLCHYTNLQPLWALDNIKKGDKIL